MAVVRARLLLLSPRRIPDQDRPLPSIVPQRSRRQIFITRLRRPLILGRRGCLVVALHRTAACHRSRLALAILPEWTSRLSHPEQSHGQLIVCYSVQTMSVVCHVSDEIICLLVTLLLQHLDFGFPVELYASISAVIRFAPCHNSTRIDNQPWTDL